MVTVVKLLCTAEGALVHGGTLVDGGITGCDVIATGGPGHVSDDGCVEYAQLVEAEPSIAVVRRGAAVPPQLQ